MPLKGKATAYCGLCWTCSRLFWHSLLPPELRTGMDLPSIKSVYNNVYQQVQKAGPEFILQLPPLEKDDKHPDGAGFQHHGQIDKPDFHLLEDQARLKAKIEDEEHNQQKVLPRPNIPSLKTDSSSSPRYFSFFQIKFISIIQNIFQFSGRTEV